MDAAPRVRIADVRQRQVAGEVIPRPREPVTVQDGGRLAVHALVAVEDGFLEERGERGYPPPRDRRAEA